MHVIRIPIHNCVNEEGDYNDIYRRMEEYGADVQMHTEIREDV